MLFHALMRSSLTELYKAERGRKDGREEQEKGEGRIPKHRRKTGSCLNVQHIETGTVNFLLTKASTDKPRACSFRTGKASTGQGMGWVMRL